MARRRRQDTFEDLMEFASILPWQVDLVLAVVVYFVLHTVAGIKIDPPTNIGLMGDFVGKQMGVTAAMFGQIILPIIFLIGALISFFKQRKKQSGGVVNGLVRETKTHASVLQRGCSSPACPKCRNPMVRRVAKQGVNAGKEFWGCSQYPNCKGVVR